MGHGRAITDPAAFPDVEETGDTYLENALLKARAVAAAPACRRIADDSGIEVDALGGKPGVRSARFAGETATDEENLRLLMQALKGIPERDARPDTVASPSSRTPTGDIVHAEGRCEGTLVAKRRGERGFGYDPDLRARGVGRDDGRAHRPSRRTGSATAEGRSGRLRDDSLPEAIPDSR